MDPALQRMVKAVQVQANPPEDPGLRLQRLVANSKRAFSEENLMDALEAVGIPREKFPAWIEEMASQL